MADIVLKDRNGKPVEYPGVDIIKVSNTAGEVVEFVDTAIVPEILEDLPIALDFSGGNHEITAPDGFVVKSAIIQKPENLIPENIPEGLDIAGIIGTMAAGGCQSHKDFNVFATFWKASEAGSTTTLHPVATVEELTNAGIITYPKAETVTNHLWTAILVARLYAQPNLTMKSLEFSYKQNTRLFYESSSSYRQGWWIARTSGTAVTYGNLANSSPAFGLGSPSNITPGLSSEDGFVFSYSVSSSYRPIGLYLCAVIQHKTQTIDDII